MKRLTLVWVMILCLLPVGGWADAETSTSFILLETTVEQLPEKTWTVSYVPEGTAVLEIAPFVDELLTHAWVPDQVEPVIAEVPEYDLLWTVELRNPASGETIALALVDGGSPYRVVYSMDPGDFPGLTQEYLELQEWADWERLNNEPLEIPMGTYQTLIEEALINEWFTPAVCVVVSRDERDPVSTFVINRGADSSLEPMMAVTFNGALLGWVEEVGPDTAVVRTLPYGSTPIPCQLYTPWAEGIVQAYVTPEGTAVCCLTGLPEGCVPEPGGMVVTSGTGGFIRGIPIGMVGEQDGDGWLVELKADYSALDYAVVYRGNPSDGTSEEDGE